VGVNGVWRTGRQLVQRRQQQRLVSSGGSTVYNRAERKRERPCVGNYFDAPFQQRCNLLACTNVRATIPLLARIVTSHILLDSTNTMEPCTDREREIVRHVEEFANCEDLSSSSISAVALRPIFYAVGTSVDPPQPDPMFVRGSWGADISSGALADDSASSPTSSITSKRVYVDHVVGFGLRLLRGTFR